MGNMGWFAFLILLNVTVQGVMTLWRDATHPIWERDDYENAQDILDVWK